MMTYRLVVASVTAALLAGCAAQETESVASAPAAERDCFFLSQVSGFSSAGRDRINVSVGPRRTYEFQTFGSCPDIDFAQAIAFDQNGPGTICRGIDVDLIVPSSIGPQRCPVKMIRRLPEKP
jgi:hypothetical protein